MAHYVGEMEFTGWILWYTSLNQFMYNARLDKKSIRKRLKGELFDTKKELAEFALWTPDKRGKKVRIKVRVEMDEIAPKDLKAYKPYVIRS